ncbi:Protein of unknown function [Rhizobium mongolense subsp. loessense]|uniref:Tll0287-like domain-containing protein n=1 Tax=Rhizobium mongolense subsp. loessense TaxID=158890 RepID=A0A1G4TMK3_9HYPH|nr:DUF3365 domain-containing protein [Rhizobium mongolense]SCW82606.1 Protein of unknown function [Rhizobium mongolense subsp. loessense]
MHRGLRCAVLLAMAALCVPVAYGVANEADVATGERLAALVRASRSVISSHQGLINDESIGDKNLTGARVVEESLALYSKNNEHSLPDESFTPAEKQLFDAQIAAIREIVDENQVVINAKGVGFKGFIPATFARLVNERLEKKVGERAKIKVTAPKDLVRNRKALPDDWERDVIESKFQSADWPKGKPFVEESEMDGRQAFRMLIPEYYSPSCLTCHGQPKGEIDVSGYPKEGAAEGDLGGAISIMLFR